MEVKDLRIGNWIETKEGAKQFTPFMLFGMYNTEVLSVEQFDDRYKPIPLTEEWAIKFDYECLIEMITDLEDKAIIYVEFDYTTLLEKIQRGEIMVHQWQNIWHSLTNEELTLKE